MVVIANLRTDGGWMFVRHGLATGPESQHQRQRQPARHRHRYRFAVPDYQPIFELDSCHPD
jgi:hypothetical protein